MFPSALYAALAVFTLVPTSRAASQAAPITLTLPSNIPSSANVVQDNFAGISIEFNVADIISVSSSLVPGAPPPLTNMNLVLTLCACVSSRP